MKTAMLAFVATMVLGTSVASAAPTVIKLQYGGTTVPQTTPIGGDSLAIDEVAVLTKYRMRSCR